MSAFQIYEDLENQLPPKRRKEKPKGCKVLQPRQVNVPHEGAEQYVSRDKVAVVANIAVAEKRSFDETRQIKVKDELADLYDDSFGPMVLKKQRLDEDDCCVAEDIALKVGTISIANIPTAPKGHRLAAGQKSRARFFDVVDYQSDILEYLRNLERKLRPNPNYMRLQTNINANMRSILVDWLYDVGEEYTLSTETVQLSVSYVDRFLSIVKVVPTKLQLVGVTALFIAAKYEEIISRDVASYVYITNYTYGKGEILRLEKLILKHLQFDLGSPTPYAFIRAYGMLLNISAEMQCLAEYLCDLALVEGRHFLAVRPSKLAAIALALTRHIFEYPMWSKELQQVTTYALADFEVVLVRLSKLHKTAVNTSNLQAVQTKYRSSAYKEVAAIPAISLSNEVFNAMVRVYKEQEKENEDITDGVELKPAV